MNLIVVRCLLIYAYVAVLLYFESKLLLLLLKNGYFRR